MKICICCIAIFFFPFYTGAQQTNPFISGFEKNNAFNNIRYTTNCLDSYSKQQWRK